MSNHVSAKELDRFQRKTGHPREMLAIDRHLASCAECRSHLQSRAPTDVLFRRESAEEPEHLSYQQIEGYVDGVADDIDKEIVSSHAELCQECSYRIQKLQMFAQEMAEPAIVRQPLTEKVGLWDKLSAFLRFNILQVGAATAAVAIGAAAFLLHTPSQDNSTIATLTSDSPDAVRLSHAQLSGLPENYQPVVKEMLSTTQWAVAPALADVLKQQPGPESFKLDSPVGEIASQNPPTFRWQPLPQAANYRVAVFDSAGAPVLSSEPLTATQWTATKPLPNGRTLLWRVTATRNGEEVTSPSGPPVSGEPFAVASPIEAQELERARSLNPNAHLLLGLLHARLGAVNEAQAEFELLQKENPDSGVPRQLLSRLADMKSRALEVK